MVKYEEFIRNSTKDLDVKANPNLFAQGQNEIFGRDLSHNKVPKLFHLLPMNLRNTSN